MSVFATKLAVKALKLLALDSTTIVAASARARLLSAVTELGDFITVIFKSDTQGVSDHTDINFRKALNEIVIAIEYFKQKVRKTLTDTVTTIESKALKVRKSMSDSVATADGYLKIFRKANVDNVSSSDTATMRFSASKSDYQNTTDDKYISAKKHASDSVTTNDNFSSIRSFVRAYMDTIVATDDFYGLANVDDDQSAKFTKILSDLQPTTESYSHRSTKPFSDTFAAADIFSKESTKNFGDAIAVTESGNLFLNSYIDKNYFANSYVGITKTF